MSSSESLPTFRVAVLSVVKHDYLPRAVAAHPRCRLAVVADDSDQPDWVHERNEQFADAFGVPYVRDVPRALADYGARINIGAVSVAAFGQLGPQAAAMVRYHNTHEWSSKDRDGCSHSV